MKRIIPFLALFCITILGYGQISIDPEFVDFNHDNLDLSSNILDEVEKFTVCNISDQTVELVWVLEKGDGCNSDWDTQVCDNNVCYDFNVNSNQGILLSVLEPDSCSNLFALHVWPRSEAGCCNMQMYFYLKDNLQDAIGTVEFDVRINDTDCLLSDTKEEIASSLHIFPNPVSNYFRLDGNESSAVKELVVYNLLGRPIRSFNAIGVNEFDMTGMPQGIYLVGMVGENGELIKTVKISRQFMTP